MTATGGAPFATTHRMIDWVHTNTTVVRTLSLPPQAACFAPLDVAVIKVANLTDSGTTAHVNTSNLARGKTNLSPVPLFRHQLRRTTSRTDQLSSCPDLQFDVMNRRSERNVAQRQ